MRNQRYKPDSPSDSLGSGTSSGFPDFWTSIPDASDSAQYKALCNSVAIPCVDYVVNGMATILRMTCYPERVEQVA